MPVGVWEYEDRAAARRRQIQSLMELSQQVSPLVASGDFGAARQTLQNLLPMPDAPTSLLQEPQRPPSFTFDTPPPPAPDFTPSTPEQAPPAGVPDFLRSLLDKALSPLQNIAQSSTQSSGLSPLDQSFLQTTGEQNAAAMANTAALAADTNPYLQSRYGQYLLQNNIAPRSDPTTGQQFFAQPQHPGAMGALNDFLSTFGSGNKSFGIPKIDIPVVGGAVDYATSPLAIAGLLTGGESIAMQQGLQGALKETAIQAATRGLPSIVGSSALGDLANRVPEPYRPYLGAAAGLAAARIAPFESTLAKVGTGIGFGLLTSENPGAAGTVLGGGLGWLAPDIAKVGRNILRGAPETAAETGVQVLGPTTTEPAAHLRWDGEGNRITGPEANMGAGLGGRTYELPMDQSVSVQDFKPAGSFVEDPGLTPRVLSRTDRMLNNVKKLIGMQETNSYVQPVIDWAGRQRVSIINESKDVAAEAEAMVNSPEYMGFKRNKKGQILDLIGKPTMQDLAARLPVYWDSLTKAQQGAMMRLQKILEPYGDALRAVDKFPGNRPDIMPPDERGISGFYLPRGNAMEEGADTAIKISTGRRGRSGYAKAAVHVPGRSEIDSMSGLIDTGYEYTPFRTAIEGHIQNVGRDVMNTRIESYYRSVTGPDGIPLGRTALENLDGNVRSKYVKLVDKVAGLRAQIRTAEKRAGINNTAADELDKALNKVSDKVPSGSSELARLPAAQKAADAREALLNERAAVADQEKLGRPPGSEPVRIKMPVTGEQRAEAAALRTRAGEVKRVADRFDALIPEDVTRIRGLDTAIHNSELRAQALAQRGGTYAQRAEALQRELVQTRAALEQFRPEYAQALEAAGHRPGTSAIAMNGLNGLAFPDALAKAANDYIDSLKPLTGAKAVLVRVPEAINGLLRGLKASADVSFLGIQGLIGAGRDKRAYGKALGIAVQSIWDRDSLGKFLLHYNEDAVAKGLPLSQAWGRSGLHIGGADSEFAVGTGLAGVLKKAPNLPVVKQSNTMFGYFGDAIRLELAQTAYKSAEKHGFNMLDPTNMEAIANVVNSATGWSRQRFAGDLGELALFAPRFFQSQLNMVTSAVAKGGIEGREGRRMMLQYLGSAVAITAGVNAFAETDEGKRLGLKHLPWETLYRVDEPNFMRIRWKGQDISLLGPWDTLAKGIIRTVEAKGDPRDFFRGKSSPIIGDAWTLISGHDFQGKDIYSGGTASSAGRVLANLVAPFSLEQAATSSPYNTAVGLTGLKASPLTATENLDAVSQQQFGMNFYDLQPIDQKTIREAHPDLWKAALDTGSEQRQKWNEAKLQFASDQKADDAALLDGKLNGKAFSYNEWDSRRSDRAHEALGTANGIYGADGPDPGNPVLRDYFKQIDASKVNGIPNWDTVDAYKATLSPADQKTIDRNSGLNDTPLEALRRTLSNDYYNLPVYQGYTADQARQIDLLWQNARNTVPAADDGLMLGALDKLKKADPSMDPAIYKGAQLRVLGILFNTSDRDKYVKAHPEVALLLRQGAYTPADLAAIKAALAR